MKIINVINKNKGLTLIEIIVTMAILGIISSFLFSIFITSSIYAIKSNQNLEAINLGQEYMEKIKACNITEVYEYKNKTFYKGSYIINTNVERKNEEYINAIKIIVTVNKDDNEILNLESYKKIR